HIGFGKRTHGGAGETTAPVIVHVRPQLIAGEPVDLVLFNAIVHDFVAERDAVGRARVGTFAANFAEILDAVVNGLVRHQRQVGRNRVGHVDARTEVLVDDETVASEFPYPGGYSGSLRNRHTAQRRVAEFLDVAFQRFENHVALDLRHMIGGIADEVPMGLQFLVVPGSGGYENVGKLADEIFRAMAFVGVLGRAVLHIASAGV